MSKAENVRLYSFHVPGYVEGIARLFSGGSQAYIDEDTKEVLAEGPMGQPLSVPDAPPDASPVQAENVSPALVKEVQPERSVEASTTYNFVGSGDMGG